MLGNKTESHPTAISGGTRSYYWSSDKILYERIGNNYARNYVYALGKKLAPVYIDARNGWVPAAAGPVVRSVVV